MYILIKVSSGSVITFYRSFMSHFSGHTVQYTMGRRVYVPELVVCVLRRAPLGIVPLGLYTQHPFD